MSEAEYLYFIQCRQTKFFNKSMKSVLSWLQLRRDSNSELRFRKVLEAFGYIMRFLVQKIVLQAVKIDNGGILKIMTQPVQLQSYEKAYEIVSREIQEKCDAWRDQIIAFKVYNDENQGEE